MMDHYGELVLSQSATINRLKAERDEMAAGATQWEKERDQLAAENARLKEAAKEAIQATNEREAKVKAWCDAFGVDYTLPHPAWKRLEKALEQPEGE